MYGKKDGKKLKKLNFDEILNVLQTDWERVELTGNQVPSFLTGLTDNTECRVYASGYVGKLDEKRLRKSFAAITVPLNIIYNLASNSLNFATNFPSTNSNSVIELLKLDEFIISDSNNYILLCKKILAILIIFH